MSSAQKLSETAQRNRQARCLPFLDVRLTFLQFFSFTAHKAQVLPVCRRPSAKNRESSAVLMTRNVFPGV